jgi:hypothetical protein
MKRVLCALALGGVALVAVPAHATTSPVTVVPVVTTDTVGAGVFLNGQPVAGAFVHPQEPSVCAGIGDQIPLCVGR